MGRVGAAGVTSYCAVSLRDAWIVHVHKAHDWDSCVAQGIMRIVRDRIRGVSDSSCVNHSTPCTTRSFKPSWQTTWFTQAAAEQCMLSNGLANVDTEAGNICDVTKLRMLDRQDGQWRCRHAVLFSTVQTCNTLHC